MSFPSDWDITPFFDDNEIYILENPKKSFEDNGREYKIYQFILKSIDYTDDLFNVIMQIKNTFLEREKIIFELNQKIEHEKRELEENINKKINSIRTTPLTKKTKNDVLEKNEEISELKSIDDIMTTYSK
jgi:hypothetical protein